KIRISPIYASAMNDRPPTVNYGMGRYRLPQSHNSTPDKAAYCYGAAILGLLRLKRGPWWTAQRPACTRCWLRPRHCLRETVHLPDWKSRIPGAYAAASHEWSTYERPRLAPFQAG